MAQARLLSCCPPALGQQVSCATWEMRGARVVVNLVLLPFRVYVQTWSPQRPSITAQPCHSPFPCNTSCLPPTGDYVVRKQVLFLPVSS